MPLCSLVIALVGPKTFAAYSFGSTYQCEESLHKSLMGDPGAQDAVIAPAPSAAPVASHDGHVSMFYDPAYGI